MKKIFLIIITLFIVKPLISEQQEQIEISADIMEWDKEKSYAVAIGNAKVTKGNIIIIANKITAILDNNLQDQNIEKILAYGNVKFTRDSEVATGNKAIYNLYNDTIVLEGAVNLKRQENIIKGEKLSIDFKTGLSKIEGSNSSEKVKMKYNTKEVND